MFLADGYSGPFFKLRTQTGERKEERAERGRTRGGGQSRTVHDVTHRFMSLSHSHSLTLFLFLLLCLTLVVSFSLSVRVSSSRSSPNLSLYLSLFLSFSLSLSILVLLSLPSPLSSLLFLAFSMFPFLSSFFLSPFFSCVSHLVSPVSSRSLISSVAVAISRFARRKWHTDPCFGCKHTAFSGIKGESVVETLCAGRNHWRCATHMNGVC